MSDKLIAGLISTKSLLKSKVQMEKIITGNITKHTLVNDAPSFADQLPFYITEYRQYLKTKNFSMLLECEGRELV